MVISLYSRGLTTGEIAAHFDEAYGALMSKDTISRITEKVEDMDEWTSRPLQHVYAAIFIDAPYIKSRNRPVGNQPFYAAIGVDPAWQRDVIGLWRGTNGSGESARFWMNVLNELRNRGVRDVFFVVCDGSSGLPNSVATVLPAAIVQTGVIHLIRGGFRYASKR